MHHMYLHHIWYKYIPHLYRNVPLAKVDWAEVASERALTNGTSRYILETTLLYFGRHALAFCEHI